MSNNQINSQQQSVNLSSNNPNAPQIQEVGFPLHAEIDRLEDIIMYSFKVPLIGKMLVDEESIVRQLDELRLNIPDCYTQALDILAKREKIITDAQNYAQKIVENAQRKASQLLDESRIVQQAENQAYKIKRQVQEDCENLQRKTMSEVEQIRKKIQQEVNQMKKQALLEADEIHREADIYSDSVLSKLERDLAEMLRIITNGRQQINQQASRPMNHQNIAINKKAS
jgi:F0F1-type ATP synthase membrane subunit b/b'